MPGPHMLTPPPNHATSVRHYCPLCAATVANVDTQYEYIHVAGHRPAGAGTALAGAGSGRCSATGVAQRRVAGAGAAAWARAGGRSHYENRRKSGLSL